MSYLEGAYEVEPADGDLRSSTLKDHNVKTFFVKQKEVKKQVSFIAVVNITLPSILIIPEIHIELIYVEIYRIIYRNLIYIFYLVNRSV